MRSQPVTRGGAVAVAMAGGERSLTSLDLLFCLVPISFFLSIVSFV